MQQKLFAADPQAGSFFGDSVAVVEDNIVVGAPMIDDSIGSAHYYRRVDENWTLGGKEFVSVGIGSSDLYGSAVAISNESIMVGAPMYEGLQSETGSVEVFVIACSPSCPDGAGANLSIGPQGPTDSLQSQNPSAEQLFGHSVSSDGNWAVVGAPGDINGN